MGNVHRLRNELLIQCEALEMGLDSLLSVQHSLEPELVEAIQSFLSRISGLRSSMEELSEQEVLLAATHVDAITKDLAEIEAELHPGMNSFELVAAYRSRSRAAPRILLFNRWRHEAIPGQSGVRDLPTAAEWVRKLNAEAIAAHARMIAARDRLERERSGLRRVWFERRARLARREFARKRNHAYLADQFLASGAWKCLPTGEPWPDIVEACDAVDRIAEEAVAKRAAARRERIEES